MRKKSINTFWLSYHLKTDKYEPITKYCYKYRNAFFLSFSRDIVPMYKKYTNNNITLTEFFEEFLFVENR